MRDDVKKFRTGCLLIIAIIVVCIVFYVKNQNDVNKDLKNNGRYTIGITYEKDIVPKGNDYIKYYFYFNGSKYSGRNLLRNNVKVPGGRYYVVFSTKNPYNSYMFFNKPVPDRIKIAPKEGWIKLDSVK